MIERSKEIILECIRAQRMYYNFDQDSNGSMHPSIARGLFCYESPPDYLSNEYICSAVDTSDLDIQLAIVKSYPSLYCFILNPHQDTTSLHKLLLL